MICRIDTSALAKRYLTEKGSPRVRRLLKGKADVFYQSFLTSVELTSALYRRHREGEITSEDLSFSLQAYVTAFAS